MKPISIPSHRGRVRRTRNIEKLALREWCALKKAARLELFFTPWTKCDMFFLELLPFSVRHIYFRKVGRGGGHLQLLKKIYRPRVIFKVLGPPCDRDCDCFVLGTVTDNAEIHRSTCQNHHCEGSSVRSDKIFFLFCSRDVLFFKSVIIMM